MKANLMPANSKARAGLHIHPYTVALSLGKQIRFSAPLEQILAELRAVTRKRLTQPGTTSDCQIRPDDPTAKKVPFPKPTQLIRP